MTDTPIGDEQIEIEAAMHELAELAVRARAQSNPTRPQLIGDTADELIRQAMLGEVAAQAYAITQNPIREAAKAAICVLGQRLFEIGGLKAMEEALDRVVERDPDLGEQRAAVINLAWDGIGGEGSLVGWVA